MKDRARCEDCKWFGGLVWITQKAVCKKNAELVRPHWLACGVFEPIEEGGGSDAISSQHEQG